MPKLYSARLVLLALQKSGFSVLSQKGSHIKLNETVSGKILTVIVPNHREIALGTFASILRQAKLTREEFEKFLK